MWAYLAALAAAALATGIVLRARPSRPRLKVAGTTTAVIGGGFLLGCSLCLHSARDIRRHVRDETADFAHVITGRTEGWLPSSSVLPLAK